MPNRFENHFSHFIRSRRHQLNLTQQEVADALGVTSDFIGLVELGYRRLDLDKIPQLADVLNVESVGLSLWALRDRAPQLYQTIFNFEPQCGGVS
jgi:transcriptional regulator with XRE-family HTH domain